MKKRTSGTRAGTEALWEWNLASNRIHFSPRWIALVGCDEHDVGNAPEEWLNRVHPDERPAVLGDIDAARNGDRDEIEFSYGGQAAVAYPADRDSLTDEQWAQFLFFRDNPKGRFAERWVHTHGCRRWFELERETR